MKPLSVLVLCSFDYPHRGGVSTHISNFVRGAYEHNISVDILSLSNVMPKIPRSISRCALIRVIRQLIGLLMINMLLPLFYFLKKWDFIIVHDVLAFYLVPFLRIIKRKICLVVHTYFTEEVKECGISINMFKDLLRKIEIYSYTHANKIISVDNRLMRYVTLLGASPKRVKTIKNCVNTSIFYPFTENKRKIIREKLDVNRKTVILVPRRLVPKNGVVYAVLAMRYLSENFVLLIVGDGIERNKIEEIVRKYNLQNKVRILGSKPHYLMPFFFNIADIVVIPSITIGVYEEATSIAALEAMACKVPVVASNIGGLREIICNKVNGILVSQKNPKKIADAILTLLNDHELKAKIIENAYKIVLENYSPKAMVKEIIEFLSNK